MSESLTHPVLTPPSFLDVSSDRKADDLKIASQKLREMVLRSVASVHSQRNYAKALDELFALCANRSEGISRQLLMEYRAAMIEKRLSPSTINVRLAAVRKLVDA